MPLQYDHHSYHTTLINKLQSVHRHAAQFIFQDYKRTSNVINMPCYRCWNGLHLNKEGSCVVLP